MKTTILLLLSFFIMAAYVGCRPDVIKPYQSSDLGSVESIAGTWNGISVNQTDVGAELKNFPYRSLDITSDLGFTNVKLTLEASNGVPSTFNINYGSASEFFKFNSGTWAVDNTTKVGKIYLIKNTDTITMQMGSYQNLLNDKLIITQSKLLLGKPAITYEFQFSK